MEIVLLKDFIFSYGLPTVVISVAVGVISLLVEKILKVKLPKLLLTYAPFILAVVLHIAYDTIFVLKNFSISMQSVYAGLISGSLSIIIKETAKKILSGKRVNLSATAILIEGLITGYVKSDCIVQTAILLESVIADGKENDSLIREKIYSTLKENSEHVDEQDLIRLATLIIATVTAIE